MRAPAIRALARAILGSALLLVALATPALGVDPIPGTPLPDEPPVAPLAERVTTALVHDLDGDGIREVVAITADRELPGYASVQAWWVAADGSDVASNQVRLRRSATFDDRVAIGNGIRIDDEGMTGVRISEAGHLFTVRRDGREVVLALGMGRNSELTSGPCCVTLWEVSSAGPGEITLDLAAETYETGLELVVADLDADGTDELVISEGADVAHQADLAILEWDGDAYAVTRATLPFAGDCCPIPLHAGDTDGIPGDDVHFLDPVGTTEDGPFALPVGWLIRMTERGGTVAFERAVIGEQFGPIGARSMRYEGRASLLTTDGESVVLWSWGRDETSLAIHSRPHRGGRLVAVLGAETDQPTALVGTGSAPVSLTAFDLATLAWSTFGADSRAGVFATFAREAGLSTETPVGIVPGGIPGDPEAFVFGGMLVRPMGGIDVEAIAVLPGRSIVGVAGPQGAWMGTLPARPGGPTEILSATGVQATPDPEVVAILADRTPGTLELVATASVLEPETNFGILEPSLAGVAPDPNRSSSLIVGTEAVDAIIEGPPGTRIWWSGDGEGTTTIAADGRARIRLLEPASAAADEGSVETPRMWLVTPAGHAYHGVWQIRVYRQPPDIGMDDVVPIIDFAPAISGRTLPGSTLTLNGQPAEVEDDGSFTVPVLVGIVPTEIRVAVTDPVGNRTERVITRVWPLDYRQLPWAPIAVFLTITVGFALFMREADARPGRRQTPEDEATFEEIGG